MRKYEKLRFEMAEVVENWSASKLSLKDYCKGQKITVSKFKYWHKKIKKSSGKGFTKVEFTENLEPKRQLLILTCFEIHYPSGVKLLVNDSVSTKQVQTLIHL